MRGLFPIQRNLLGWSLFLASGALAVNVGQAARAQAQSCGLDASCEDAAVDASFPATDAAAPGDASAGLQDAGASPDAGGQDAATADAGSTVAGPGLDAGKADAGGDAGATETPTTAACSCESSLNSDGLIHVCTGSFEADVCSAFSCEDGTVRARRCPASEVRLCCDMPVRGLYSQLYEDCSHPNCESGFRAQCEEFGGRVSTGACDAPELPDDEDTELGNLSGCNTHGRPAQGSAWALLGLVSVSLLLTRRKKH
jgi:hypothetical protein